MIKEGFIHYQCAFVQQNRKTDPILRGRISPEKITITLTNNRVQPLTKEDKENKLYVPSNGRDESYERLKQSRAMMRRSTADDSKRKDSEADLSTTNSGEQKVKERTRLATNDAKRMADERGVEEEEEDDDEVELTIGDTRLEYDSELEEDRVERKERKRSETNSSPRPRSLSYGSDNGKANDEVKKWLGTADLRSNLNDSKLSLETDSEPVLEICPNTR
ncbi:hypothetical protein LSTR_LSTR015006 [Laodelphax striatellus]|uniref:Uncharacterized protein n=1 Tax=Laodelphax striatellus TaxID=195883 RepID=A0A482WZY0_LAOST|nr:hypothetical protein LSTR_LSTR015006 [Laodelphax striatellus]